MPDQHTCSSTVYQGTGYHRVKKLCGKRAKVERNGNWFCGTHDPVARKEKQDSRTAAWNAKFDRDREIWKFQKAAMALCEGVPTERLEELGAGWLMAHLEREDDR